ncbi:MAG: DUF1698 domain-containing protein [Acidobacteria bacterium]|nr:DUF1698 domain-containing protein [Acidobacteriota bacterium]
MDTAGSYPSRRGEDFSEELAGKGWYHSFALPDGTVIQGYNRLEVLNERYARLPIPRSLAGRRVLDIGAWDGWFSFEAERNGAGVTAVDCVEVANFHTIHRALSSRVEYRILDFYDLPQSGLGPYDFVFFLGVLYHLKHPLLALEIVCALTTDTAIVESFVTDADTWREHSDEIPAMEFYETDELGNQLDNWIGPSVGCLLAMCRAAGFARVELLYARRHHAGVACHRTWEPLPEDAKQEPPELIAVSNTRTFGINFFTRKEEYVSCWFRTSMGAVARDELRLEIAGFGIRALYVKRQTDDTWMANFRLPPGLRPGWNEVRLRLAQSHFGSSHRIAVDIPLHVRQLVVKGVRDGTTWSDEGIRVDGAKAVLSCWVHGLPENADRANVYTRLGEAILGIEYVGEPDAQGLRQINATVSTSVASGVHPLIVECGGVKSDPWPVSVAGGDTVPNCIERNQ